MKLTFGLLLIFILIPISVKSQESHLLQWSENRKLVWEDFRKIDENDEPPIGMVGAITDVTFDYEYLPNGKISPPIAKFNRLNSWTTVDDSLSLVHEQLHFDINELYARKMRKEFVQLYINKETDRQNYLNVIDLYLKKAERIHNDFDRESYEYSPPRNEGLEWMFRDEFCEVLVGWQEKISQELEKLKDYSLE